MPNQPEAPYLGETDLEGPDYLVEYVSVCPACGQVIDYCQGHGEIGDPEGRAILTMHEDGDHSRCHPNGCEEAY